MNPVDVFNGSSYHIFEITYFLVKLLFLYG